MFYFVWLYCICNMYIHIYILSRLCSIRYYISIILPLLLLYCTSWAQFCIQRADSLSMWSSAGHKRGTRLELLWLSASPRRENIKGNIIALFSVNKVCRNIWVAIGDTFININVTFIWIGIPKPHLQQLGLAAGVLFYYLFKRHAFLKNVRCR